MHNFKNDFTQVTPVIQELQTCFKGIHNFLDVFDFSTFIEYFINQMSHTMHYNSREIKRYCYKAKSTKMFTDIIVLDSCRYIYDWLPSISHYINIIRDKSWQYILRFAIDGIVKQRQCCSNDIYYKNSVINSFEDFPKSAISKRRTII